MYKFITCPECGQRACRANYGSDIEMGCTKCRTEFKASVDVGGSILLETTKVHSVPPRKPQNKRNK